MMKFFLLFPTNIQMGRRPNPGGPRQQFANYAKSRRELRIQMGTTALKYSLAETASIFGHSRQLVSYWKHKVEDLSYHDNSWGGH